MPHPFTENASLNPKKGEIDMDDSNIHIVKRTDQWKERAVQSYIVPRGVLCVELTPDGNTRIKIGEGNKYYSQLPYIGANIDISKYFTKEEVKKLVEDTSEATVIAYMDKQPYVRVLGPILPSASALPKTGNKDGDIRFVKMAKVSPDGKAYIEYLWFNNHWDPLSSALDIDVSKFATKEELAVVAKAANDLAKRVTLLEQAKHIHPNKSILDSITAPFTTELAAKLSGIEPNANKYVLPISTRHSLGGIIIGEGLLIDAAGRVSVDTSGIIVPPYDDTEVKRRITNLENVAHTHINKSVLDATTASYTTAEKTKLASLENYTLPTASSDTLGGVKVGDGLTIDADGVLSTTGGGGGQEYVAGDGISIDEGSSVTDITSLAWEQGSINPVNGEQDDFTTTVIRSPMIEVGLTNMLNVSAQALDDTDMRWEAAFYDSNSGFISMTTTWQTLSDEVIRPDNAKYVVILLRKETETDIDENALKACEISWPIEIGKYVITNTGVTHAELESSSVIITENGETKTLLTFGQDLDVTNGVVSIPDYHRLVLNVEE